MENETLICSTCGTKTDTLFESSEPLYTDEYGEEHHIWQCGNCHRRDPGEDQY